MVKLDERHTNGTNGARVRGRVRSLRARMTPSLAGAAVLLATLGGTTAAHAQMDVNPSVPNVLILLDTSGSMERKPNGNLPNIASNATSSLVGEKSRWISALEVLGGNFQTYSAMNVPRDTVDYGNEYKLNGPSGPVAPYDFGYSLPHFRPLANGCTVGPPTSKSWNPSILFTAANFGSRTLSGSTLSALTDTACPSPMQVGGVLSAFQDNARFGLMTFDSQPAANTGYPTDAADGVAGQWSYFPGWKTGATAAHGWPNFCDVGTDLSTHVYEVGARNPNAPPWEGPLIPLAEDANITARIRLALASMRPSGATPIGPMMADAYYYFRGDPEGPLADPQNACRGNFIILITDGFPNLDLRPGCESNLTDPANSNAVPLTPEPASHPPHCSNPGSAGCCPSMRAQDIAQKLANPTDGSKPVETFVVGFALSDESGTPIYCTKDNTATGLPIDPTTDCVTTPTVSSYLTAHPKNMPCCTLNSIAYSGTAGATKRNAFIATTTDSLRDALNAALSAATASTLSSRTVPVFARVASGSSGGANATQYQFQSSFQANKFGIWGGTLERLRWMCPTTGSGTATLTPFSPTDGDDFGANLNSAPATRGFFSWNGVVAGTSLANSHDSSGSIRPKFTSTEVDGVEKVAGVPIPFSAAVPPPPSTTGPGFVNDANMTPSVMGIASTCDPGSTVPSNSGIGCMKKYLNYALGQVQDPSASPAFLSRSGNALGDIYHATPVSVGPPSAFIRDESYTAFRNGNASRLPMLLVATNDGLLHAFREDVATRAQNELWAFIPPAVMPLIPPLYGATAHSGLLDASPVVRDVAFAPAGTTVNPYGRARADVRASKANWRTIAVGALTLGGGYYALDVTEPTKPVFLWQLTTAASSTGPRRLFGPTPGTPAIGVVYYQEPGSTEPIETPVAFLPGGGDTPWGAATRTCTRWPQSPTLSGVRTSTHCWTGSALSFTVVRLLDGKIIRTFRNNPAGDGAMTSAATNHPDETATSPVGAALSTVVVGAYAKIDAPISGTVATYPAATGTVTTRAFVGDLDGTLWKADVSAPDPASWTFGIFHDAYAHEVVTPALVGQPISAAPVVSVDRVGDVMVVYGTGNQNKFDPSFVNHVWSVTERVSGSGSTTAFTPTANWHMRFDTGLTPTGPLTLFNEMTYFSTYSPDSASAGQCLSGSGTLWSVHYLDSDGTPTTDEDGSVKNLPKAGFVLGSGEAINTAGAGYFIPRDCRVGGTLASKVTIANQPSSVGNFRCMELDQGSIVFGAGVTSRPSCADPAASSLGTDPITGATTSHTQPSAITPGSFELVVQTGPRAGTGAGGSSTKTLPRTLVAPVSQTRIDSWAAIVE